MPRPNVISQTLTTDQLTAILTSIGDTEALMPWLIGLIDTARKGGFKLGPETLPFLIRANQLGHQDQDNFVPKGVNLAEMDKDTAFAQQVWQIWSRVQALERKLHDTFIETGLEGLESALTIKSTIKQAAKDGIAGAKAADDELSALFKRGPSGPTPPPVV